MPDARSAVRRATRGRPTDDQPEGRQVSPQPGGGSVALAERVVRFLAAITFLCGVVSFAGSSLFDVRSITVTGNQAVAAADVLARSGIHQGTGIFTVNAGAIRARLRQDPRIAGASVSVRLPDAARITIQERPAAAALRTPSGYFLIGRDGVVIEPAKTPGGLPALIVDRLDPETVQVGTVVPSPDARTGAAIAASLPDGLRPDVAAVRVDQAGEIVLYTRDHIAVRTGPPDGVADRIAQVSGVLAAVRARGMKVQYVDLRFPGSIIVKPLPPNSDVLPREGRS
jgi:cell division protein FtsQ